MRAAVLHSVGDLRVENVPAPELEPEEQACLVRVHNAGICSSDVARIFRDGTYRLPLIPGHEFSGSIAQSGPNSPVGLGQKVAVYPLLPCFACGPCARHEYPQCERYDYFGSRCDGGFAEFVKVPYFNLVPVPEEVSFLEAALCEPASVALHGLRVAELRAGDTVLIVGAGTIGVILAQWAFLQGAAEVTLADISDEKLAAARAICPRATCVGGPSVPIEEALQGRNFSVCVECTGVPACYPLLVHLAESNGRLLFLGNPSDDIIFARRVVSQILRKQLIIRGTWNSTIAPECNEWMATLQAVAAGHLNLHALVTHRYPLAEARTALEMMADRQQFFNRVILECS